MVAKMVHRMFYYLDRFYLRNNKKHDKLTGGVALELFYTAMTPSVQESIRDAIQEEFTKDRNGQVVDKDLMRRVVQTYYQLGLVDAEPRKSETSFYWEGTKDLSFYNEQFEKHLIKRALKEYHSKASAKIAEFSAPEYLKWADQCFQHEEGYCDTIFQPETRDKLMKAVVNVLITQRNTQIVEKDTGVKYMIDNQRSDELLLLYNCFSRDEKNLTVIVDCLKKYIETQGKKIIEDPENVANPMLYTQKVLAFKEQIDQLIIYSFKSNIKFEKGRDQSFQNFLNESIHAPNYIATFTDNELTTGIIGQSSQEIEKRITAIVRIFCCLNDRDLFLKELENFLHFRLLNKKISNKEAEEMLIGKIQMEQGFSSVQKMTSMFKDIELSKDLCPEFNSILGNRVQDMELSSIQVLTQGTWPMKQSDIKPCILPQPMKQMQFNFERWYATRAHNKKLFWLTQYGQVEVQPKFVLSKTYTLVVNSFQAAILDCYNERDVWTFGEIMQRTNMPDKLVIQNLFAMCNPKVNLLTKEKKVPKFEDPNEKFTLNLNWKNNSIKVVLIPVNSGKKKADDKEEIAK